ncbi:hypothetical protein [Chroococcus sp. FPU101]|uniref:hypothetical protein n=1 Tax=Chroococcus sp. FPU101 TaxID=1974212 RepID=UPI001A8D65D3|nr:hypothetical protein [Chroococcus sp. FPU101]GFE70067.1 hypothetical protein CFPU101_26770 [Chroococcus sp. FPU101]
MNFQPINTNHHSLEATAESELNSTKRMGRFSKKVRNLLALLLAIGTWQVSIPATLLLTSSVLLTSSAAYAVETMSVTVIRGFNWDATYAAYKILIQFNNGNQYYVWYENKIDAKVGSVITLTYEGSDTSMYMYKLINFGNGREARVLRYLTAN